MLQVEVEEVGGRRDLSELAEHGHDLAAMEGGMVDDMEDDFPTGASEGGAVEAGGGEVGFEVGGGGDVGSEGGDDGGPSFFEIVEGGAGVGVGEGNGLSGEPSEPSSIGVVDVLERCEDGGVRDFEVERDLVKG